MAEHLRPVDGRGRRRRPASRDARGEQLVGSRSVVPHGDLAQRAQSRRVVDEKARAVLHHDVVRVLVLDHDLDDREVRPADEIFERVHLITLAVGALRVQPNFLAQLGGEPGYPHRDGRRDR
jgi:hypothetical protein